MAPTRRERVLSGLRALSENAEGTAEASHAMETAKRLAAEWNMEAFLYESDNNAGYEYPANEDALFVGLVSSLANLYGVVTIGTEQNIILFGESDHAEFVHEVSTALWSSAQQSDQRTDPEVLTGYESGYLLMVTGVFQATLNKELDEKRAQHRVAMRDTARREASEAYGALTVADAVNLTHDSSSVIGAFDGARAAGHAVAGNKIPSKDAKALTRA